MYGCLWIVVRDCEWSIEPILKVTRSENDIYNGMCFSFFLSFNSKWEAWLIYIYIYIYIYKGVS